MSRELSHRTWTPKLVIGMVALGEENKKKKTIHYVSGNDGCHYPHWYYWWSLGF
ncbi:General secretion pathway protein F [Chlamydia trachomatis]|nr:General secretion pathway protein F [Chlamydia trachomatis]